MNAVNFGDLSFRSQAGIMLLATAVIGAGLTADPDLMPSLMASLGGPGFSTHKNGHFSGKVSHQIPTAGPLLLETGLLDIHYPEEMQENQTRRVELIYKVKAEKVPAGVPTNDNVVSDTPEAFIAEPDSFDGTLEFGLESSGFEISGEGKLVMKAPVGLPFKQVWTITPKSEGTHDLLLHFREARTKSIVDGLLGDKRKGEHLDAQINGQGIQPDANGWYALPVTVKNFFGVSRRMQAIFIGGCALLGFILSWQVLVSGVTRWLGWDIERKDEPPAKSTGNTTGKSGKALGGKPSVKLPPPKKKGQLPDKRVPPTDGGSQ
ncbi:MAG: hypothetical protein U1F71_00665 [Verrucomicrobiaceae bacterium]